MLPLLNTAAAAAFFLLKGMSAPNKDEKENNKPGFTFFFIFTTSKSGRCEKKAAACSFDHPSCQVAGMVVMMKAALYSTSR